VGSSTTQPGTLSIRRMADTTAGLIRRLGLRRPDLAGWSMGGMIAQSMLVRHPALVRRAALLATAPGDGYLAQPDPAAIGSLTTGDPSALLSLLFGSAAPASATADYVTDLAKRKGFMPTTTGEWRAQQAAACAVWLGGRDRDGDGIATLRLPVLVAGGREDPLLPIGNQIHIAQTIPRAVWVAYPGAAHGFFVQEAADFAPRLLRFLR